MTSSLERSFRITALAEATSFLALLVATYIKYAHDEPIGVEILGPLHGLLFIAYVVLAVKLASRLGWAARTTLWCCSGPSCPSAVTSWTAGLPGGRPLL